MLKPDQQGPRKDAPPGCVAHVLFTFGPELSDVPGVTLGLERFLEAHGVPAAEAMNARLAASEACNNALQYVSSSEPATVEVIAYSDRFQIIVTDHSNLVELVPATKLPPPEAERGRGLFLIRQVMDSMEYRHETGGNKLVLTRQLPLSGGH